MKNTSHENHAVAGAAQAATAADKWPRYLADLRSFSNDRLRLETQGLLVRVTGLVLEAAGIRVPVGSVCEVRMDGQTPVTAEVVGFSGDRAYLMATSDIAGLASGARVVPRPSPTVPMKLGAVRHPWRRNEDRTLHLPVGDGLLGRVVDSHGMPMDRKGPIETVQKEPLIRRPINAMDRDPVRTPLDTGVRAINAMLTVGRGQRIGLFAGTGVGKSVLLGMMARYTAADVIVVGLIGERGREVKEFIEDILGDEGMRRAVVVAAPADAPPLVRMQGANYATLIAEHFRDRGLNVLLLMDSLTRYAMAQREIALAIGEPPATKGYPPSCFAKLPQLCERSGNGPPGGGSITAFYTVLSEGDDPQDPIADAARGILDGHIVLSRELAESGHYPAIDIEKSVSRVMTSVAPREHIDAARRFRQLHSRHQKARDLIQLGAYVPGNDAELDTAVRLHGPMTALLQQGMHEPAELPASVRQLRALVGAGGVTEALQATVPEDVRTLGVLLGQAEKARDAALADHHRAQAAARAAEAQSTQLLAYRREYEARWQAQFRREGPMDLVRCFHQFMEKLTIAVEHQARAVAQASLQTERSLARVREAELRCASVAKLIERRLAEARLKTDRREQKQADEHAMRAAWARRQDEHTS